MMHFEGAFFRKEKFTKEEIIQFLENAKKDLNIAKQNSLPEVKFTYSYTALIKGGITLIAKVGGVKVRSAQGHHIKILEKTSKILQDEEVTEIGNAMRTKRNLDFYGSGVIISEQEANDYCRFVEQLINKVEKIIQ